MVSISRVISSWSTCLFPLLERARPAPSPPSFASTPRAAMVDTWAAVKDRMVAPAAEVRVRAKVEEVVGRFNRNTRAGTRAKQRDEERIFGKRFDKI